MEEKEKAKRLTVWQVIGALIILWVITTLLGSQFGIQVQARIVGVALTAVILAAWFRFSAAVAVAAVGTGLVLWTFAGAYYKPTQHVTMLGKLDENLVTVEEQLATNMGDSLGRVNASVDSSQLTLEKRQATAYFGVAAAIRQNTETFKAIRDSARGTLQRPDTLSYELDVTDNDPLEITIPSGMQATFWTDSAYYMADLDVTNGDLRQLWYDANGEPIGPRYTAKDPSMYAAPGLNRYAVIYSVGLGTWNMLGMQAMRVVQNPSTEDKTLAITLNDKQNGFGGNQGTVRIRVIFERNALAQL